jgi:hypothetical protein
VSKRSLLALARDAAAPDALTVAGRQNRFGDSYDHSIERGQIWRAAWDDVSLLVVVASVEHAEISAIPVTLDPGAEDAESFVLDPALTVFGVETTFWVGLRTRLPFRVLDEIIDELPVALGEWVSFATPEPKVETPAGVRLGRPARTVFDSSNARRAEIEDDLAALQAAPGLPVAYGAENTTHTLASILGNAVDLRVLVDALGPLGLDQPGVMSLLRGKKPMTPDLVDAIAAVTEVDRALIAQAVRPLPAEFVNEVDHPRWRPTWRERAQRDGLDVATARLQVSYEMFAQAARQTGSQTPDWSTRLVQFRRAQNSPGTR